MCTIIAKNHFIGKNFDSIVNTGMLFTNKRGLIKVSAVFPPDRPLEWVSAYGSITFSQSGKEYPASGMNERGLVVEQTTLRSSVYPDYEGKPVAGILEITQYLLDTCGTVKQALNALDRIAAAKTSWPVHFALFDREGNRAVVEYLKGEKKVYRGVTSEAVVLDNTEYLQQGCRLELKTTEAVFDNLEELRVRDTVWSNVYDLKEKRIYIRAGMNSGVVPIELDQLDFSAGSRSLMLNIKDRDFFLQPYSEEANRQLVCEFFRHPVIDEQMKLENREALIDFMANQSKSYDTANEIVLRFLEGERIKQIPVKENHKLYVLKYLASKFETGKAYTESQVNAVIDEWHTFGDYFILRRELIDSRLLRRLPNGSRYWRE